MAPGIIERESLILIPGKRGLGQAGGVVNLSRDVDWAFQSRRSLLGRLEDGASSSGTSQAEDAGAHSSAGTRSTNREDETGGP